MGAAVKAVAPPVFRFDAAEHLYSLDGALIPSITQMLERTGHISEAYYTAESAERGHEVHQLCAAWDLGAIEDLAGFQSVRYKGWLLAYVAFGKTVPHIWTSIEEAYANVELRFGGRPDRVGKVWGVEAIVDLKSGGPEEWHGLQTALQDILIGGLPVGVRKRYGLYLQKNGRFRFIPHDGSNPSCSQGRGDYDEAYRIIRECTR